MVAFIRVDLADHAVSGGLNGGLGGLALALFLFCRRWHHLHKHPSVIFAYSASATLQSGQGGRETAIAFTM